MKFLSAVIAPLILAACQQVEEPEAPIQAEIPLCHCETTSAQWYGSVRKTLGAADGPALVFALDPDSTTPNSSRQHTLWIETNAALDVGTTFSNSRFAVNPSIYVRVVGVDSSYVDAEFRVRDTLRDSAISGNIRLQRLQAITQDGNPDYPKPPSTPPLTVP